MSWKNISINSDSIENYNEDSDEGYFLDVDVPKPEILDELYNGLSFFTWKNKNWKNWETCN